MNALSRAPPHSHTSPPQPFFPRELFLFFITNTFSHFPPLRPPSHTMSYLSLDAHSPRLLVPLFFFPPLLCPFFLLRFPPFPAARLGEETLENENGPFSSTSYLTNGFSFSVSCVALRGRERGAERKEGARGGSFRREEARRERERETKRERDTARNDFFPCLFSFSPLRFFSPCFFSVTFAPPFACAVFFFFSLSSFVSHDRFFPPFFLLAAPELGPPRRERSAGRERLLCSRETFNFSVLFW